MSMFEHWVDLGTKLWELDRDLSQWSQETFGDYATRGPLGALRHLEKEAVEAQQAVGTNEIAKELADCLILTIDAARRSGLSLEQLLDATAAKLEECKGRQWPKPVGDEPCEHVR